jgi:hypothetical protein
MNQAGEKVSVAVAKNLGESSIAGRASFKLSLVELRDNQRFRNSILSPLTRVS